MLLIISALAIVATIAAMYFGMRLFTQKKSLQAIDEELRATTAALEGSRMLKLPGPDRDVERLLATINGLLEEIRQKHIIYARRETELKSQIEYISHDLRTPLTSIQGYLALINQNTLSKEDGKSLEIVRRKADNLQGLIAQFYELSLLDNNELSLELQQHDIARQLRELLLDNHQLFAKREIEVTAQLPSHPVFADIDLDAFERIVVNLMQNAARYSLSKFIISLDEQGIPLTVSFSNDVVDFSEDEVKRLFSPFYTRDASRTQESSGLGLAIAHRLAEHMGMVLQANLEEVEDSQMLSFTLQFPGD